MKFYQRNSGLIEKLFVYLAVYGLSSATQRLMIGNENPKDQHELVWLPCAKSFIADDLFLLTRSKVSILTGPNGNLLNYTYQIDI